MLVTHKTKCVTRILFTITHQIKICPFTFSLPIKYFQPYKKIIVSCHRAHLYVLGAGVYLQLQHFSSLILYFRKKKGCSISLVAEKKKTLQPGTLQPPLPFYGPFHVGAILQIEYIQPYKKIIVSCHWASLCAGSMYVSTIKTFSIPSFVL